MSLKDFLAAEETLIVKNFRVLMYKLFHKHGLTVEVSGIVPPPECWVSSHHCDIVRQQIPDLERPACLLPWL